MLKIKDLRTKTADELEAMLSDLRKEGLNLRFQKSTGQLEKTHRIRQAKKEIAKIKTVQKEQKKGA